MTANATAQLGKLATITTSAAPTLGKHNSYNAAAAALAPVLPPLTSGIIATALAAGQIVRVKVSKSKSDTTANTVTVTCTAGDTFESGGTTQILAAAGEKITLSAQTIAGASTAVWVVEEHTVPRDVLDARFASRPTGTAAAGSYVDGATNVWTPLPASGTAAVPAANDITARLPDYGRAPTSFVLEPAPATSTVLGGDDFSGTANASLAGRSSTLGTAGTWTANSGTWQIDGAGGVSPTAATDGYLATVTAVPAVNAAAYSIEVNSTYRISGTAANMPALVFRYVDTSNFWYAVAFPTTSLFAIYEVIAGSHSRRAFTTLPGGLTDGAVLALRVDLWQNDITTFVNGVEQFTFTSTTTGVGSRIVGLRQGIVGGYTTPAKWSVLKISTYKGVKYNFPRFSASPSAQVLQRGYTGAFDDTDINNANVVWDPINLRWVLYYSGFKNGSPVPAQGLGLAYAPTIAGPWTKDSRNPVVTSASGNVENGALVWSAGRWLRASENTSLVTTWQTSPDLVTWTTITPTGLTLSPHDPFLRVNQNGLLELWYGSGDPAASIYKATSTDGGLTWNAPTTPVFGAPPIGNGNYRGNGEPSVYSLPGREGVEMVVFMDVSEVLYKSVICAAITTDGGANWHWRNVAGGEGTGFASYQKFDSYPVFAEGALHIFHSGGTVAGNGVNLNTTIGRMTQQWVPNPRSLVSYGTTTFATLASVTASGTAQVGQVLTAAVSGTWAPVPDTVVYQWLRGGTPISGATSSTYTLVTADAGSAIACLVSGVKSGYSSGVIISNSFVAFAAGTGGNTVADNFTRANATYALGTTSTGGQTWAESGGPWGVLSNQAYNAGNTSDSHALVDVGTKDHTVQVTAVTGTDTGAALVFRANGGADKTMGVLVYSGSLYTRSSTGTFTANTTLIAVGGGSPAWTGSGEVMKIVLSGTSGSIYKNGTLVATFTDSLTGIKAGIRADKNVPKWAAFSANPS